MGTEDIRNYKRVDDRLSTGGQPSEDQLRSAAAEGFQAVINLAALDPRYSLADEAGLVRSLGMAYYHIPVAWDNPQPADFEAFAATLKQLDDQKVLIHCAANYRVTAFYALYAMRERGWSEEQADAFMAQVWQRGEVPIWEKFIAQMKARL
jgi:uncharacterized protein (TIGR01244 family)